MSRPSKLKKNPSRKSARDTEDTPWSVDWPLTPDDVYLFGQGTHRRLYDKLGARPTSRDGRQGVSFSVWAPAAKSVSVVGSFNGWDPRRHPMQKVGNSGVWFQFVESVPQGAQYKFHIESRLRDYVVDKADPFATRCQVPPETASVVWDLDFEWNDAEWMARRAETDFSTCPMSTYELHLGSWRREKDGTHLNYRRLADELVPYLTEMGFTHVEFLPVTEHPFYGSWGYQVTGFFAPTSRYGSPQDLMHLIDRLHQAGIGVILDWVPSHFPIDEHGIAFFDGTHLFEHEDRRLGFHPDWKSHIFNYGRKTVRSFLISSAHSWLDRYHIDALRVDAVASMLYLDYSREEGQWVPNKYGGRENLDAITFLKELNTSVHETFPGVNMIAEESTAWPMVSRPTHLGGLGFDMKWDMGWMHDTLEYLKEDPIHRRFHQDKLTFRALYAHSERFVLSLSHDEVVHGKGSLPGKMFGDPWQKLANLRALYGYMFAQPGKKLLFMGSEIGLWREWDHDGQLEWELLDHLPHAGLRQCVTDLNHLYREEPALFRSDFDGAGFRWVDCADAEQSVVSFTRHGSAPEETILVVCNFTPVPRYNYRVGVDADGSWQEIFNSDAAAYGGGDVGNMGRTRATAIRYHDRDFSLLLTLPPLSVLFFKREETEKTATTEADATE